MILQNDRDNVLLELNDDELIIKRFFKNTQIKKENIISAYLTVNTLFILCRNNKYISKNITSIKLSQMKDLEVMINELNKENLIFCPSDMYLVNPFFYIPLYISIMSNSTWQVLGDRLISITLTFFLISSLIIYTKKRTSSTYWVYSIQNNEFQKFDKHNMIIHNVNIEDIRIKESKLTLYYKFVNGKNKFFLPKDIKYPLSHKQIVRQIYKSKTK